MLDKVHQGDCLEVMKAIPAGSVDMVLCDLPYGVTRNAWDSVIALESLWAEYRRVVKPSGAIVLFCQGMFTANLMASNATEWRYNLVWQKDRVAGFLNANKMPLRDHEDIAVFYREMPTYNPQKWEGKPQHARGGGSHGGNNYGKFERQADPGGNTEKHPRSVLYFPKPHPAVHPTEKPVELCEYLIRTYTNQGETVLDNCVGSGTTAVAALQTMRHYIAIEREPKYAEMARRRLASTTLPLFG